jgi:hypothetical protein
MNTNRAPNTANRWISSTRAELRRSSLTPWIALFLALALAVTQFGGKNALSRFAAMRAITEGHVLNIDNYKDWTIDWSLSPNGHYYSNKAPGGALLGLPVWALLDLPTLWLQKGKMDEHGRAPQPPYPEHLLLVLFTQLLPFAWLVLEAGRILRENGTRQAGLLFFALASLFGNTAAIYMNSYFGHGLAGLFFLAGFLFWLQARYAAAGFFLAAAMLTDYAGACAVPFLLLATAWRERRMPVLVQIALGALPIAALWIWFHITAFGGPFAVASAFIDPAQVEKLPGAGAGGLALFPSPSIILRLLFGPERGILFTQPWVFMALLAVASSMITGHNKLPRGSALFLLGGFLAILWTIGSTGSWHGGWTIGPRYLSLVFPALALALAWSWNELPSWAKAASWAGLAVSLLFRILIFPFSNLAPLENLWSYHWNELLHARSGTPFLRLAIALLLSIAAALWAAKRQSAAKGI